MDNAGDNFKKRKLKNGRKLYSGIKWKSIMAIVWPWIWF